MERLEAEYRMLDIKKELPLTEDIGNGLCRVMLEAVDEREVPLTIFNRLFMLGARKTRGAKEGFTGKLRLLMDRTVDGDAPFSAEPLGRYLENYARSGYPAVHHSERYRALYSPAYRVVPYGMMRFWPLYQRICNQLAEQDTVLIAVDGMAASGKTTLCALLEELFACSAVHMDDFFLPGALRTPARLRQPGGNVHYERFAVQVSPFLKKSAFTYAPFDCRRMDYAAPVAVPRSRLTVVEGAYSLHPELHAPYDLRVFLKLDGQEQKKRVLARNGTELGRRFLEEWIPMENAYFEAFGIPQSCDLIF
jgi:uridine kinase